jgi:GGDEF domain-containing protein
MAKRQPFTKVFKAEAVRLLGQSSKSAAEGVIEAADAALYLAKRRGKHCVETASPLAA